MQNQMQEYWVNVFDDSFRAEHFYSTNHLSKNEAINESQGNYFITLYRIHVKMRPVYLKGVLNDDCERKPEIYS